MPIQKTITVNGRTYDALTGLPVKTVKKTAPTVARPPMDKKSLHKTVQDVRPVTGSRPVATAARAVHAVTERSKTLRRGGVKKPASVVKHPTRGRSMDIAKSGRITKFAPHPTVKKPVRPETPDRAPQVHPIAQRALAKTAPKPTPKPLTSKQVKEAAIATALSKPAVKAKAKRQQLKPWQRRSLVAAIILIAVFAAAFAIYRFVPTVTVSVAAAQAGVQATYPEYVPDGYSLHHPVTYSPGEVVLTFASNSNSSTYTVTQTKSSWDSAAVLDNVVKPATGDNYVTTRERGLTIYTYDTNASWVNGGILYTIHGNAQLSSEQVRRIATSL